MERGNLKMKEKTYPAISDKLIECLERDYPDKLPRSFKDSYELGILIGQQQIIDKLRIEKAYNEEITS